MFNEPINQSNLTKTDAVLVILPLKKQQDQQLPDYYFLK